MYSKTWLTEQCCKVSRSPRKPLKEEDDVEDGDGDGDLITWIIIITIIIIIINVNLKIGMCQSLLDCEARHWVEGKKFVEHVKQPVWASW